MCHWATLQCTEQLGNTFPCVLYLVVLHSTFCILRLVVLHSAVFGAALQYLCIALLWTELHLGCTTLASFFPLLLLISRNCKITFFTADSFPLKFCCTNIYLTIYFPCERLVWQEYGVVPHHVSMPGTELALLPLGAFHLFIAALPPHHLHGISAVQATQTSSSSQLSLSMEALGKPLLHIWDAFLEFFQRGGGW